MSDLTSHLDNEFNEEFYNEGGITTVVDYINYLDRPESNVLDQELRQYLIAAALRVVANLSVSGECFSL